MSHLPVSVATRADLIDAAKAPAASAVDVKDSGRVHFGGVMMQFARDGVKDAGRAHLGGVLMHFGRDSVKDAGRAHFGGVLMRF